MKSELLLLLTFRYSLTLTSISFKDFPFLYETIGGSLNTSLSNGWFWIKCHLLIKMFLRRERLLLVFRSFILGWRFISLRGCFPLHRLVLSLWLWLRFLLECASCCWVGRSPVRHLGLVLSHRRSTALSSWSNSFAGPPVFFSLRFSRLGAVITHGCKCSKARLLFRN